MTTPKHRANKQVRTKQQVQVAPRHKDITVDQDGPSRARVVREFSIRDLMAELAVNPYRGAGA